VGGWDVGGRDVGRLTSTICSMCFRMMVGSALGFTDTAHSSIMVGLGSGAGTLGLEFCFGKQTNKQTVNKYDNVKSTVPRSQGSYSHC